LDWWSKRAEVEGQLHHAHYERLFTEPFGLQREDFRGAAILDVGCGPRGSLEWADDAAQRIGLDPLARAYRRLGTADHSMTYVQGRAEAIPFPDCHFDIVSSFNALDHTDDAGQAAHEMARVLRPGGKLLLIVEVNHAPTSTEPLTLGWDLLELFPQPMHVERVDRLERVAGGIHENVLLHAACCTAATPGHPGVLVARLRR
jgi:ubiquinone/menaquinone biosynthesis C-methylase UbiE